MRLVTQQVAFFICRLAVLLVPTILLAYLGALNFAGKLDSILSHAAPLVSAEISRQLHRTVIIGRLSHDQIVWTIFEAVRHPDTIGTIAVTGEDVVIGTRTSTYADSSGKTIVFDEEKLAGSNVVGRAPVVNLFIALPAVLAGDFSRSLARVEVKSPEITLIRDVNGQLNVMQITEPSPRSKPSPPFRTFIHVDNGRLRFCDFATARAAGQRETNEISHVTGDADLRSAADYRFDASAVATQNTPTARRLRGALSVNGSWGRTAPGNSPERPAAGSARFLVHIRADQADLPYWFYYFLDVGRAEPNSGDHRDTFRLEQGIGDLTLSLAGPRPDIQNGPTPGLSISLGARFAQAAVTTDFLSTMPITAGAGTVEYSDGSVEFNVGARALDRPIEAAGELWGVTADRSHGVARAPAAPQIAVNFHGSDLPIARIEAAVFPNGGVLPPGLRTAGNVTLDGVVSGPLSNVVVAGSFSGLDVGFTGLPSARNITANVAYVDGILAVTQATGEVDNGGPVSGHGAMRLVAANRSEIGNSQFSVNLAGVDLRSLDAIRQLGANSAKTLQITGHAEAQIIGTRRAGTTSLAANVWTSGLAVGELAFPTARARILLTAASGAPVHLLMTAGRLESPAGSLRVNGDFVAQRKLHLNWSADALDLNSLAAAFGFDRLAGLVSATGTVDGDPNDPRVVVRECAGLNLTLNVGGGEWGQSERQLAVDSLQATNMIVRKGAIHFANPLVLRRYPASVSITGDITNLMPRANGSSPEAPLDPRLNLNAIVERLEFKEIEAQLESHEASPTVAAESELGSSALPATKSDYFAGSIAKASVAITGLTSNPVVVANATVGRMLVGSYPIDGGLVDLIYESRTLAVRKASLTASIGTVDASGKLLPDGTISGNFTAQHLDAEKLSYLTQSVASIGGTIDLAGSFSGTSQHPIITANVAPSTLTLAGTTLSDVTAHGLRYDFDIERGTSRITIPSFSFKQNNSVGAATTADTTLSITDSVINLPTGVVTANVTAEAGDIGVLLKTLQRSGLRDTGFGSSIVTAIDNLPEMSGQFSIDHLTLGAVIIRKPGPNGTTVYGLAPDSAGDLKVSGKNITFGTFTAPLVTAHATLDKSVINLDNFSAIIPQTATNSGITVRSHGTFGFDGDINAVVESNAVAIDSLRTIPQIRSLPLRGSFDVSVLVRRQAGAMHVTASLQGNNIDYLTGPNVIDVLSTAAEATAPAFRLDQIRAEGEYIVDSTGNATISIPEALVTHGNIGIHVFGSIPLTANGSATAADNRAIALTATVPTFNLSDLAPLIKTYATVERKRPRWRLFGKRRSDNEEPVAKPADLAGAVSASLTIAGTLKAPTISGDLLVSKAHFTFPHSIDDDKDRINPIKNLDAHIVLSDGVVNFDKCVLTLGGPNGEKGDFGSVAITGSVTPDMSSAIDQTLDGKSDKAKILTDFLQGTALDLAATFNNFRPFEDNLFGFGESVQARLNGTLTASGDPGSQKGSLAAPLISAAPGKPIEVADAVLKLKGVPPSEQTPGPPLLINPQFPPGSGLPIAIDGKAVITDGSSYQFEANGTANITGSFASTSTSGSASSNIGVLAVLNVLGGYYKLPTAIFRVEKNNDTTLPSQITLRYGGPRSEVLASNIIVKQRINVYAGTTISPATRASQNSLLTVQNAQAAAPTTAYSIQITIDGPLNFLNDPGSPLSADKGPTLSYISDPYLTDDQIVALLGGQSQVQEAASGNVAGAIGSLGYQYVSSNLLPSALSPLTEAIQNKLGLDAFDLDYDPQGNSLVFVSKRLSDSPPFDRFVAEYTQEIETRSVSQVSTVQPYLFSLSYDLLRLRATSKHLAPTIQIGFSNDYLNVDQFFVRGTMAF